MLEVLIRRHYREYELVHLTSTSVDGRPFAIADYTLDKRPTHLVSTIGRVSELVPDSALVKAVTREVDAGEPGHEAVVDLYSPGPRTRERRGGVRRAARDGGAARRHPPGPPDRDRGGGGESRAPRTHLPADRGRRRR